MERYKIESCMHSIVQPGMLDLGLERDGHFSGSVRVAFNRVEPKIGNDVLVHTTRAGWPVAYEYGVDLFLVTPPATMAEAWRQFSRIAGVTRGSLDKIRFYMALRRAMWARGLQPNINPVGNMLRLAQLQAATRER